MISLVADVLWTIVFLVAFLGYFFVLLFVARALYRVGARRSTTGWWISVWAAIVVLVVPLVGLIPAGVVRFKDGADIGRGAVGR
jgi:hypothetical protein